MRGWRISAPRRWVEELGHHGGHSHPSITTMKALLLWAARPRAEGPELDQMVQAELTQ